MNSSEGTVAVQDRDSLLANWQQLSEEGYTAFEKRRYVQAESKFQEALKAAETLAQGKNARSAESTVDREDIERLTKSLNNLAALYHLQAKYEMAEAVYERCLDLRLDLHGDDHLDVAVTLHNLAALSCAKLRWDKAEILYKRALEIRERQLGLEHADLVPILKNYAIMLRKVRREDEAKAMEERKEAIAAKVTH